MQKIKYIIIFTLLLALGLLYVQLDDYDKITNRLIKDNRSSLQNKTFLNKTIEELKTTNSELKNTIMILKEKIISLEEKNHLLTIQFYEQNITRQDKNASINFNLNQEISEKQEYTQENINTEESLNITPNITLDDENKITGFGVEYKQEF